MSPSSRYNGKQSSKIRGLYNPLPDPLTVPSNPKQFTFRRYKKMTIFSIFIALLLSYISANCIPVNDLHNVTHHVSTPLVFRCGTD